MRRRSLAPLWLIWFLVVFGAMNISAAPNPDPLGDPPGVTSGKTGLANLLILLRDDGDTRRYFAYAEAILGRPYDGYFLSTGDARTRPSSEAHALVRPNRPLFPWRDFTVEYPPGMLVAALLPALFTTNFATYHLLFCLLMEALLTASVWLAVRTIRLIAPSADRDALQLSILFVAALGVIGVRRYDALVALAIAAAVHGLVARRPAVAGLGLGIGAIVKATPLLLAPIGAIHLARGRRWRELAIGAVIAAAAVAFAMAIYLRLAGDHALDALVYHLDRPVQIESPYGAVLMLAETFHHGFVHIVSNYGSDNIQSPFEPALRRFSSMILASALAGIGGWFWWSTLRARDEVARLHALAAACTAALIAFIGLGKIFSPQYLIWLLPSGVIAAALSSERSRLLLLGAALLTQLEFPFVYQVDTTWVEALIAAVALLRDAALIGCALSLMLDATRATVMAGLVPATRVAALRGSPEPGAFV